MYTLEQPKVIHKSFTITSVVEKNALINDLATDPEQYIEVSGYASRMYLDGNFVVDADGENVNTFGFDLKRLKNGTLPLLFNHQQDKPVGKVLEATYDKDGLLVKAKLFKYPGDNLTNFVYHSVKNEVITAFSVGILVKDFDMVTQDGEDYLQLSQSEVIEISLVAVPSNAEALFRVTNLKSVDGTEKTVTLLSKSALKAENSDACNGFECAMKSTKQIGLEVEKVDEMVTKNIEEDVKEVVLGVTEAAHDKLIEILDSGEYSTPVQDTERAEGVVVAPESEGTQNADTSNDKPSEVPQVDLEQTPEERLHTSLHTIGDLDISKLSDDEMETVYDALAPLIAQIESRVVAQVAVAMQEGMTITPQ